MQAKKNKRRFTIQFNEIEPSHLLAIEVLNDLPSRSVARYIALAIEYYESNIKKVTKKSNTDNSVKRKRGRPPKVQSKPEETQSVLTEQKYLNAIHIYKIIKESKKQMIRLIMLNK